jgi:Uma2 family endonuclease
VIILDKNKSEYTVEEVSHMEKHAELINGELVVVDKASTEHNRTVVLIVCAITNYINEGKSSGEVFSSNVALYCKDIDDRCSAEFYLPDIMVVCNPDIIDNEGIHGTPDMVIEVVSPESKQRDYNAKLSTYKIIGVREYWIVDLADGLVTVYLKKDKYMPHHYFLPSDIPVSVYQGKLAIMI